MSNPFSLTNKRILVTGASSGIGKAIAIESSKLGAKLVITGRDVNRLDETYSKLDGSDHLKVVCDICNTEERNVLIDILPSLDGVVHNAGINTKSLVKFISKEKIDDIFNINVYAPVLITQALIKKKKLNKKSSIVFISSISTFYASISNTLYASSKGAINSFARSLALELASSKTRVNIIQPGVIETSILDSYTMKEELDSFIESIPLGGFGAPEDVAYGAIYLLSNASNFVTGSVITIDGGVTLR
jgi:NAD(P)-dependent dehydrogenase (short-subunit alcohol dehydrogenase family)